MCKQGPHTGNLPRVVELSESEHPQPFLAPDGDEFVVDISDRQPCTDSISKCERDGVRGSSTCNMMHHINPAGTCEVWATSHIG
jgi:hypothetical protein